MGLLDGLLGQVASNVDIENLASKIGLSPDQVASAVQALGIAHPEPGDTVASAAASTGLSADVLSQIVEQIGGEGALGRFASLLREQDSGGILGNLASGLFGKS
ncbi:MAG: hypothetical protein AB7G25_12925 [Sphingomonadaceae bacterium]